VIDEDEPLDPPYAIRTARLLVRCWDPRDAPLLKEAIDTSLEHLRPWMPWAHNEPQPLPEKARLLRRFRGQFDLGQNFIFGIFSSDESEVVGGTGLHPRVGDDAFEIGYWIRSSRIREGLATEATAALTRVAFVVCGVERIEIHVDPANAASLAVPRRLGFREEATLRRRLPARDGEPRRDETVFTLFRDDPAAATLESARLEAYGSMGERVL
jgi:RimJ/RimL family protein N-acetyltransferase